MRFCSALLLTLALTFPGSSMAQTQSTAGAIQGTVMDATGGALPGTMVAIRNLDTNATESRTTDQAGRFVALQLPPGRYTVTFTLQGFNVVKRELDLPSNFVATINAELAAFSQALAARPRQGGETRRVRRGLMLELDLEHYDFRQTSASAIRPTEGTMVERLAPRIAVRQGAELEVPHILVLIDDPLQTVIEPIAAARESLAKLYYTDLMQGGGRVAGYAVAGAIIERAVQALHDLASPQVFAARYAVPLDTPVMLFAMGDGNHSLATAKSFWDSIKATVGMEHPSRYALVEVENIHDPALEFEPIHRLLFGVSGDVRQALAQAFGNDVRCTDVPSAAAMRERVNGVAEPAQAAGLIGPGARFSLIEIARPPSTLAVGTLQTFIDTFIAQGGATHVDYVHGDDVLERLAVSGTNAGIHFATLSKRDLLRRVVREGPLPRKTFSMGEAHEKRYYVEARRIGARPPS